MKHYGKKFMLPNVQVTKNNSYACVDHVCLYVGMYSLHTYDCLSFVFKSM